MSNDYDVEITTDDTLELDTIIEKSSRASDPVGNIKYNGSDSTVHNSSGIQTNTFIFDPQKAGKYTIPVNGQELTVKVTDTNTIPNNIVENFEDNDLSEYSGNTGSFTTQTSPIYNGSYSLGDISRNNSIYSDEGDGLPYYPKRGDVVEWRTKSSGGNDIAVIGLFMSGGRSGDGYVFYPGSDDGTSDMEIRRHDNGSSTIIADKTSEVISGEWMRNRVESTATDLTYKIFDSSDNLLAEISGTDDTYNHRGIMFSAYPGNSDGVRNWDYLVYK